MVLFPDADAASRRAAGAWNDSLYADSTASVNSAASQRPTPGTMKSLQLSFFKSRQRSAAATHTLRTSSSFSSMQSRTSSTSSVDGLSASSSQAPSWIVTPARLAAKPASISSRSSTTLSAHTLRESYSGPERLKTASPTPSTLEFINARPASPLAKRRPTRRPVAVTGLNGIAAFIALVNAMHPSLQLRGYDDLYEWSITELEAFWSAVWTYTGIVSSEPWREVLEKGKRMEDVPKWFLGARLNFAENLLCYRDDRVAIVTANENGFDREFTYNQLYSQVRILASSFRSMGIKAGDTIAAYLPNCSEAVALMLAAASIGAIWSSSSPDLGPNAVVDRFGQIRPKLLFSVAATINDGAIVDNMGRVRAVADRLADTLLATVVLPFVDSHVFTLDGIANVETWTSFVDRADPSQPLHFEQLPFDHPLFILYSSGTTGKPKCIVHSAGGALLQHKKEHMIHGGLVRDDVLFYYTTTSWMMWQWLVSGLSVGLTLVLYNGSPFKPKASHIFDLVDELGITCLGTSAKYLQSIQDLHLSPRSTHSLTTLRHVYSTGSPLAVEQFEYVRSAIKPDVLIGSITGGTDILSLFAGHRSDGEPAQDGEIMCRCLGMAVEAWDESGNRVDGDAPGDLVCTKPFPVMPVFFWGDDDRRSLYRAAYFERFEGVWFHGDYVSINPRTGGLVMLGRSDGTLKPAGVRFGSSELYNVVTQFEEVRDSLAVGQRWRNDERVVLYLRMAEGREFSRELAASVRAKICEELSVRHAPAFILPIDDIPYTHTGKKVEIAVKKILNGEKVVPSNTLVNPDSLLLYKPEDLTSTDPSLDILPPNGRAHEISTVASSVIGCPDFSGRDFTFLSAGLNSIHSVILAARLREKFGADVPAVLFLGETARPSEVARWIDEKAVTMRKDGRQEVKVEMTADGKEVVEIGPGFHVFSQTWLYQVAPTPIANIIRNSVQWSLYPYALRGDFDPSTSQHPVIDAPRLTRAMKDLHAVHRILSARLMPHGKRRAAKDPTRAVILPLSQTPHPRTVIVPLAVMQDLAAVRVAAHKALAGEKTMITAVTAVNATVAYVFVNHAVFDALSLRAMMRDLRMLYEQGTQALELMPVLAPLTIEDVDSCTVHMPRYDVRTRKPHKVIDRHAVTKKWRMPRFNLSVAHDQKHLVARFDPRDPAALQRTVGAVIISYLSSLSLRHEDDRRARDGERSTGLAPLRQVDPDTGEEVVGYMAHGVATSPGKSGNGVYFTYETVRLPPSASALTPDSAAAAYGSRTVERNDGATSEYIAWRDTIEVIVRVNEQPLGVVRDRELRIEKKFHSTAARLEVDLDVREGRCVTWLSVSRATPRGVHEGFFERFVGVATGLRLVMEDY
ncbi:hypothetical protein HK101_000355 [Irineochytrium annulatum]|nr:hypothetical protein HK101_000355 [Irineochytrium annulatum]